MPLYSDDTATRSFLPAAEIPSTFGDVIGAQFRTSLLENPLTALERMRELAEAEGQGTRLSKSDAEEAIRIAGLQGHLTVDDAGITNQALSILIARKNDELQRQAALARGRGGFGEGAARLGVALGTSLLDPINVGSAFIPVVREARYARLLQKAGSVGGRIAVRAGVGAIEGTVGAAIIEPLIYTAKQQEQADYDMADSLMNLAFGSIFGGGLHVVGGAGADAIRALRGQKPITRADVAAVGDEIGIKVEMPEPSSEPRQTPVQVRLEEKAEADGSVFVTARTDAGLVGGRLTPEGLRVVTADIPDPQLRGQGFGIAMYQELARKADEAGVPLISDETVEQAAVRMYEALERRGFEVERNPRAQPLDDPNMPGLFAPRGEPVFTVRGRGTEPAARASAESAPAQPPAATRAAAATPQVQEAALRTAVGQMADGKPVNVEPLFAGDPQAVAEAAARAAETPDPQAIRQAEISKAIDEEIAQANTALEAAEEEAAIAETLLKDHAKRFDYEAANAPEIKAAAEFGKRAERWARAAEIATACLIRGA